MIPLLLDNLSLMDGLIFTNIYQNVTATDECYAVMKFHHKLWKKRLLTETLRKLSVPLNPPKPGREEKIKPFEFFLKQCLVKLHKD